MITAAICLLIGVAIGAAVMGILAGGKCQQLQARLDDQTNDKVNFLRKACGDCYELKQLRKSNAALRGDNKKIHTIIQGNKGNARLLYDLWASKNTPLKGD
jgi:hypothetical protein